MSRMLLRDVRSSSERARTGLELNTKTRTAKQKEADPRLRFLISVDYQGESPLNWVKVVGK
jgi:hypothetical protein